MANLPSLSKPLENILKSLNFYDRLTIEQVVRSLYLKPGNFTTVSSRLKQLKEERYVDYFTPEDDYVYYLEEKGRDYVRRLGLEVSDRKPRSQGGSGSGIFYRHHLAVNDLFISLSWFARDNPDFQLRSVLTMFDIDKREQYPIRWPNGRILSVSPDGFFETLSDTYVVELERGASKVSDEQGFREKIYNCLGLYEVLENENVRFLILAREGELHRKMMLKVISNSTDKRSLFYVTDADITDVGIFTSDCWFTPTSSNPVSLF